MLRAVTGVILSVQGWRELSHVSAASQSSGCSSARMCAPLTLSSRTITWLRFGWSDKLSYIQKSKESVLS